MEFVSACQAHDYGYDLVRFGVGVPSKADELLYRDMKATCFRRGPVDGGAFRCLAHWTNAVLQIGDVGGFEPDPLPVAAWRLPERPRGHPADGYSGSRSSPFWIA